MHKYGYKTTVLTVHEDYYFENLHPDLIKTVDHQVEVEKVKAWPKHKRVFVSDLTLRAFSNLVKKASDIIESKNIDFIWIPIPSYYAAILGRKLFDKHQIKYGVDYIDPWSNGIPGQERIFSKPWIANSLAKLLEPYALKKASLISAVADHYADFAKKLTYKKRPYFVNFPYGFDSIDYKVEVELTDVPLIETKKNIIYAGAFLPKSHFFLQSLLKLIKELNLRDTHHFHFIGTGQYQEKSISEYAVEYDITDCITESRDRLSYLQIISLLKKADGILVLGSTEAHYTASKVFQSLLSERPILSILHKESTALQILQECNADVYSVSYSPQNNKGELLEDIRKKLKSFSLVSDWKINKSPLEKYNASANARILAEAIDKVLDE